MGGGGGGGVGGDFLFGLVSVVWVGGGVTLVVLHGLVELSSICGMLLP